MKLSRRFSRKTWIKLFVIDGATVLALALAWLLRSNSTASIAFVVVAGVLLALSWTLTLSARRTDPTGRASSDPSRPGVKVLDH